MMIKQSQEQRADQLWQGYPTDKGEKTEEFWQTYEGLLSQEKKHRQIPTKQQWQEMYYYSSEGGRLNAIIAAMLIELLAIILCINYPPTTLAGYLFVGLALIAVTIVSAIILLLKLFYFTVSDSGIYLKDSLLYKGVSFTWEAIDKVTFVTEVHEDQERTKMVVSLKNGRSHKALDTHYDLSKANHRSFIKHLNARQIPHKEL
jgi:hypothetical protein